MTQGNQHLHDGDERYATLLNNANAIRAICSAVEGTLGPKGLDAMLVGPNGEVIITNDGVTILEKMDVTHPAANLLIQVARAQQREVGDGTTTATVLAGALVQEGVAQVMRGVPASKVVAGMQEGIACAAQALRAKARQIAGLNDPLLWRTAYIAGREQEDIVSLVMQGAAQVGMERLLDPNFSLSETVTAHEKAANEVWSGLLLRQQPIHRHIPLDRLNTRVLVMQDGLEPETLSEELLTTEAGFGQYMELRRRFGEQLEQLHQLGVGLIILERGIHPDAEQFCTDHDIIVLQRVSRDEIHRICECTGAVPLKRAALHKTPAELRQLLGSARQVQYDMRLGRVRLSGPDGERVGSKPRSSIVTIIVGASTSEVVGERARIAADAASAVQAAVRSGVLPGGGTIELAISYELERYREAMKGMESFGVAAVAAAMSKPMSQIVLNAGFNPLEKVELTRTAQLEQGSDSIGIDCDSGALLDYAEQGILDPAIVKIHAIEAAGEVAAAILRIHTVIKMRQGGD